MGPRYSERLTAPARDGATSNRLNETTLVVFQTQPIGSEESLLTLLFSQSTARQLGGQLLSGRKLSKG